MPSSASESIPYIIEFTKKHRPQLQSVLDIGVGFGKIGFLLREYYEVKDHNRFKPADWKIQIIGVDIYDGYLSELQKIVYNKIIIGDIFQILSSLGKFDLAILSDVIEHFSKDKGIALLQELFKHVEDVLIATPYGFKDHHAYGDNPHEEHQSGWTLEDFSNYEIVDKAIVRRLMKQEEVMIVYLRKKN